MATHFAGSFHLVETSLPLGLEVTIPQTKAIEQVFLSLWMFVLFVVMKFRNHREQLIFLHDFFLICSADHQIKNFPDYPCSKKSILRNYFVKKLLHPSTWSDCVCISRRTLSCPCASEHAPIPSENHLASPDCLEVLAALKELPWDREHLSKISHGFSVIERHLFHTQKDCLLLCMDPVVNTPAFAMALCDTRFSKTTWWREVFLFCIWWWVSSKPSVALVTTSTIVTLMVAKIKKMCFKIFKTHGTNKMLSGWVYPKAWDCLTNCTVPSFIYGLSASTAKNTHLLYYQECLITWVNLLTIMQVGLEKDLAWFSTADIHFPKKEGHFLRLLCLNTKRKIIALLIFGCFIYTWL